VQAAAMVGRYLVTRFRARHGDLRLVLEDLGQELVNALLR
jgi:hypothetical protein